METIILAIGRFFVEVFWSGFVHGALPSFFKKTISVFSNGKVIYDTSKPTSGSGILGQYDADKRIYHLSTLSYIVISLFISFVVLLILAIIAGAAL